MFVGLGNPRDKACAHENSPVIAKSADGAIEKTSAASGCREVYWAVGITNSAPLPMLSGQRCMMDFCLV
ncbi:hypothetical protein RCH06_001577 [Polaromonas sp. CG_9.5]|nr:hypothetical protein [Polaromonas sp. CG_9.5]